MMDGESSCHWYVSYGANGDHPSYGRIRRTYTYLLQYYLVLRKNQHNSRYITNIDILWASICYLLTARGIT